MASSPPALLLLAFQLPPVRAHPTGTMRIAELADVARNRHILS